MNATLSQTHLIHRPHARKPFANSPGLWRCGSASIQSQSDSIDEMEAVAALISMPSYFTKSDPSALGDPGPSSSPAFSFHPRLPICHFASPSACDMSEESRQPTEDRRRNSISSIDSRSDRSEESGFFGNETSPGVFFTGSVSLALPQDDDVLSPLHCFMRKYCVEAFTAQEDDLATPRYGKSHGGKIVVGQVGIRCLHCKHLSVRRRPERAACFPSSLRNIYHSIETWQRRHSSVCTELPGWAKKNMIDLMQSSRSAAGGRRHYWEDAAKEIGLVDTPHGVRFVRPPGVDAGTQSLVIAQPISFTSIPLVTPSDKELVTAYLFLLMDQMQLCKFTEEDREGGRSKIKDFRVGFHGMECKHCHGKAGFGRYFPSSINALALANSDRNIYNHLRKCRRCPESVQEQLKELRPDDASKNKRGSRKQFFTNIWERMHGSN